MLPGPFVDESCSFLETKGESPWDTYLVQLVRIQQMASVIDRSLYSISASDEVKASQELFISISSIEQQAQELGTILHQESQLQGETAMKQARI